MGLNTKIEWTRGEDGTLGATWNPLVGCSKVSPGCDHCYAEALVNRFAGKNRAFPNRFDVVTLRDDSHLLLPLSPKWQRQPLRIFVNSLSDLFHDDVPVRFIAQVFAVMAHCPRHTFQMLTKRHGRMRALLNSPEFIALYALELGILSATRLQRKRTTVDDLPDPAVWPLPNLWLGVSTEDQQWANIRIPALLATPAAIRWISAEPLLGPIDLFGTWHLGCEETGPAVTHHGYSTRTDYGTGTEWDCEHQAGLDWVVVGGESGGGARPMHPDWARSLRDQCVAAGVPFLFKQWGESRPLQAGDTFPDRRIVSVNRDETGWPSFHLRVGKKAAGRELDGRTWDEAPGPVKAAS